MNKHPKTEPRQSPSAFRKWGGILLSHSAPAIAFLILLLLERARLTGPLIDTLERSSMATLASVRKRSLPPDSDVLIIDISEHVRLQSRKDENARTNSPSYGPAGDRCRKRATFRRF
jgi:hypothetical protein